MPSPPLTPEEADRIRRRLRRLGRILDAEYRIPGTRYRFGLDPLLGLLPGVGDTAGVALSAYILYEARRLGVSRSTLTRMAANVGVDALIGTIPVAGDLFDFAYKSNQRNLRMIERELDEKPTDPT